MSKVFSFLELKKKVDKDSPLVNSEALFNNEYGFVNTGNHMLNSLMSGSVLGGYPETRIISLNGEKGCLHPDETIEIYEFKSLRKERNLIEENCIF